jgi:hypothetical protein
MNEQYTMEEWMGILREVGYSVREQDDDDQYDPNSHATSADHTEWPSSMHDDEGYYDDTYSDYHDGGNYEYDMEEGAGDDERAKIVQALEKALGAKGKDASMSDIVTKARELARLKRQAKKQAAQGTNEQYTIEEWMGIMQEAGMDEGRLGRLAAGLGLGAAALAGGAKDADAQSAPPQAATVPNDSVQTGVSRDMGYAQRKAEFELDRKKIDRQGARMTPVQNKDGTWSVTIDARKQPPATEKPEMDEQYTIEEWMGMMEEVGFNLNERNMDNKRAKNAAVAKIGQQAAAAGTFTNTNPRKTDDPERLANIDLRMGRMAADKDRTIRVSNSATQAQANIRRGAEQGKIDLGKASPEYEKALNRTGGSTSTDFSHADWYRSQEHKQQRRSGGGVGDDGWYDDATPGQKHRGVVPSGDAFMDASQDGLSGWGTRPELMRTRDRLAQRAAATKARLGLDRELRGASVPGTVDFVRDKERMRVGKKPRMEEQYTLEEWMGALQEAGYSLEEGNKENKAKKNATYDAVGKGMDPHGVSNTPTRRLGRDVTSRLQSIKDNPDRKVKLPESISENTVARLQELAGIQPLNG